MTEKKPAPAPQVLRPLDDEELDALACCVYKLKSLDIAACGRVLNYLARRYGYSAPSHQTPDDA